jgi:hypothetical protein
VEGDEYNIVRNIPILADTLSSCSQQAVEEKDFLPSLIVIASNNFRKPFLSVYSRTLPRTLHREVGCAFGWWYSGVSWHFLGI